MNDKEKVGLNVKSMTAHYSLNNSYQIETEKNYYSTFSADWDVNATLQTKTNNYYFKLERSNIKINKTPPIKLIDRVICEIGNSLYPLIIETSPFLQILDVVNLNEIQKRWQNCLGKLMNKYSSEVLKQYIQSSEKNISNSQIFINKLYQDTFINLYFRNIYRKTEDIERYLIRWQNFPEKKMNQSYLYGVEQPDPMLIKLTGNIMKILPEHTGNFKMDYKIGGKKEIKEITGQIETIWQQRKYIKQVSIKIDNNPQDKQRL